MHPILAFPALAGMVYPRLDERGLRLIVDDADAVFDLPANQRAAVRILMTGASRGCSGKLAEALPNLVFVVSQGAGQEKFDIGVLAARGIRLRSVGEAATDDVADHAMTLTQMLMRSMLAADQFARSGAWQNRRFALGESAAGKVMGIAGLSGRIGQALATRARAAGMEIAGLDRRSNHALGVPLYKDWATLADASSVLVLAIPGTPELHHAVNADVLAALGAKGRLVNVGRGSLVDTDALILALEKGTIAGAALDVVEGEPAIPARLAALPNVILTPHIAAQTWGHRTRAARIAEDEILAFLDG